MYNAIPIVFVVVLSGLFVGFAVWMMVITGWPGPKYRLRQALSDIVQRNLNAGEASADYRLAFERLAKRAAGSFSSPIEPLEQLLADRLIMRRDEFELRYSFKKTDEEKMGVIRALRDTIRSGEPYAGIPERTAQLLRSVEAVLDHVGPRTGRATLMPLASEISTTQATLDGLQRRTKWSFRTALAGVAFTCLFGVVALLA